MKLVNKLKSSHNEPITTLEQLHDIIKIYEDDTITLDKILTLEIRFRKWSLTKIKATCPLFKQENITRELKIKNVESLII